jgi:hypothetical protein
MPLHNLPPLNVPLESRLKVFEKAEITFKDSHRILGYVAGKLKSGAIVFDTEAFLSKEGLYIKYVSHHTTEDKYIQSYIPIRPIIEVINAT